MKVSVLSVKLPRKSILMMFINDLLIHLITEANVRITGIHETKP